MWKNNEKIMLRCRKGDDPNVVAKETAKGSRVQSEVAFTVMSIPGIVGTNIAAQVLAIWLSAQEGIFPGADVFMSIISTCSEIIAGLYGTTLAGYTFFLSRIDALMTSDATLDYVVASIKNRFKYLIWYITVNVLITLFISILLMYAPAPTGEEIGFFYRLFCNEFVLFLGFSIVLILYYSILVVNPNCVEKEAAKLKKKLSKRIGIPGNVVEFISMYDQIEACCNAMLPQNVLYQLQENKGKHFEYTLELLQEQNILAGPLIADLKRIHRYYECVINCSPMSVTQEMCILARRVLNFLESTSAKSLIRNDYGRVENHR